MRRWELQRWLTVVALAILGSALFVPIVAQSRLDRDELCLVRIRTVALGVLMYAQDYDETMPLAFGRLPSGQWMWSLYHSVPYDWRTVAVERRPAFASMWANAIVPYLPERGVEATSRYDWLRCPSIQPSRLDGVNYTAARRPATASYTYNGLLHQLPQAQVASPASLPIMWEGLGRGAVYGFALSNPILLCDIPNVPCIYQPRSATGACPIQSRMLIQFIQLGSFWIHPKGVSFAFADGRAEWRRLALVVERTTDYNYDPWAYYTSAMWGCLPSAATPTATAASTTRIC